MLWRRINGDNMSRLYSFLTSTHTLVVFDVTSLNPLEDLDIRPMSGICTVDNLVTHRVQMGDKLKDKPTRHSGISHRCSTGSTAIDEFTHSFSYSAQLVVFLHLFIEVLELFRWWHTLHPLPRSCTVQLYWIFLLTYLVLSGSYCNFTRHLILSDEAIIQTIKAASKM